MAADNHERAAEFWETHGDSERALLQHEMAAYERHGAELERRWAELVAPDSARGEGDVAEEVMAHTQQSVKTASSILTQLAATLDRTAALAEAHAERHEQVGRTEGAHKEREAAQHAREAAQRARSQAEQAEHR